MITWKLYWRDAGNVIVRNNLNIDERPDTVVAHTFDYTITDMEPIALNFRDEDNIVIVSFVQDFPYMIKNANA